MCRHDLCAPYLKKKNKDKKHNIFGQCSQIAKTKERTTSITFYSFIWRGLCILYIIFNHCLVHFVKFNAKQGWIIDECLKITSIVLQMA